MPLVASPSMREQDVSASTERRPVRTIRPQPPALIGAPSLITFFILFGAHAAAALYAPIQDCDEVFNFWEPTHYLNHGFGLQTWELSPVYAIRSWLYVSLHAAAIQAVSFVLSALGLASARAEFFVLRIVLAAVAATCETRLFGKVARCVNPRVAVLFLVITAYSTGSFISSASYLPSSFGMYMMTLAMADFVDWRSGLRTASGLMWLAIGTIVGWPFIAVLCLPFLIEDITTALLTGELLGCVWRMADGLARSLFILTLEVVVDSFFFRKLTVVPLNIVLYNVFAGPEKGPNIYGTEPWYFYVLNLLLNFNIWFVLALAAMPLLFLYQIARGQGPTRLGWVRSLVLASPFYLWLAIMTAQPHKEERFMYPIYPCIAVNAAMSLHVIALALGNSNRKTLIGAVPAQVKFAGIGFLTLGAVVLGLWRSVGLATAYGAPLQIYSHLQDQAAQAVALNRAFARQNSTINVCVGKEWYRFPSSYHLPAADDGYRLKFIRSEFRGLLPGEFAETSQLGPRGASSLFPGTHIEPLGMNDENREDEGKYTALDSCDFLVDSQLEANEGTEKEPNWIGMARQGNSAFQIIACQKFLDPSRSGALGRMGWVPDFVSQTAGIPRILRRAWGEYCLLGLDPAYDGLV